MRKFLYATVALLGLTTDVSARTLDEMYAEQAAQAQGVKDAAAASAKASIDYFQKQIDDESDSTTTMARLTKLETDVHTSLGRTEYEKPLLAQIQARKEAFLAFQAKQPVPPSLVDQINALPDTEESIPALKKLDPMMGNIVRGDPVATRSAINAAQDKKIKIAAAMNGSGGLNLPIFEVESSCGLAVSLAQNAGYRGDMTVNECVKIQQSSYDALKTSWSHYDLKVREICSNPNYESHYYSATSIFNKDSQGLAYTGLKVCLDSGITVMPELLQGPVRFKR